MYVYSYFQKEKVNKNDDIKPVPGQCVRSCLRLFWWGLGSPGVQGQALELCAQPLPRHSEDSVFPSTLPLNTGLPGTSPTLDPSSTEQTLSGLLMSLLVFLSSLPSGRLLGVALGERALAGRLRTRPVWAGSSPPCNCSWLSVALS